MSRLAEAITDVMKRHGLRFADENDLLDDTAAQQVIAEIDASVSNTTKMLDELRSGWSVLLSGHQGADKWTLVITSRRTASQTIYHGAIASVVRRAWAGESGDE